MYLIGPFPRPQFFGGPRPQLLAVPRPQFSIEGCYLPLEPPSEASRAPPEANASSGTPRLPAVDPNDQSATTNTGIRTMSSSPAARSRTRQPASRRATTRPVSDPGPRTASTAARSTSRRVASHDARSGPTIESTSQAQRRGHSRRAVSLRKTDTGRPSGRTAKRQRPAEEQDHRGIQRKQPTTRIATRPKATAKTFIDDPTGTKHGATASQRPHFNDRNEHHKSSAGRARRTAAGPDIERDIRPPRRRWKSCRSAPHDRTVRGSRTARSRYFSQPHGQEAESGPRSPMGHRRHGGRSRTLPWKRR